MEDIRSRLKQFDRVWEEAPESAEFDKLPDGKYQVTVEEVRFENAKTSGRLQLAWVFAVISPVNFENRKIFHYRGLDKEESIGWMKKEIYACGLKVEKLSDLPDLLPQLLDRIIEVTLKTKKSNGEEFQNCFINKLLSAEDLRDMPLGDDDVPF
jgi:hypothetical protein